MAHTLCLRLTQSLCPSVEPYTCDETAFYGSRKPRRKSQKVFSYTSYNFLSGILVGEAFVAHSLMGRRNTKVLFT